MCLVMGVLHARLLKVVDEQDYVLHDDVPMIYTAVGATSRLRQDLFVVPFAGALALALDDVGLRDLDPVCEHRGHHRNAVDCRMT
jgi:hypothetical protein